MSQHSLRIVTTSDGSKTAHSERYQQTYHSIHGAVTESRTVYVEGAGLTDYLKLAEQQQRAVRVLEVGFGLGLNFLLSADAALQHQVKLEYVAIEHDPVAPNILRKLNYSTWLTNPQLAENLYKSLEIKGSEPTGKEAVFQAKPGIGISLDILPALGLESLAGSEDFDIVYLDAFSPDTNEECWAQETLDFLFNAMSHESTLATYCVKGSVRRGLAAAGFQVTKLPGPAGKREVLKAEKS